MGSGTIRVCVGTIEVASNGHQQDSRRMVQFEGEELGSRMEYDYDAGRGCLTDTRGVTETLYITVPDGRLIVHVDDWSRWQGEPSTESLHQVTEADLEVGGQYEQLGAHCGFGRALNLDEALRE